MANKSDQDKSLNDLKDGFNKIFLTRRVKEDIHVFKERPRLSGGQDTDQRAGAHELFSLFTANIIKEKVVFIR